MQIEKIKSQKVEVENESKKPKVALLSRL